MSRVPFPNVPVLKDLSECQELQAIRECRTADTARELQAARDIWKCGCRGAVKPQAR